MDAARVIWIVVRKLSAVRRETVASYRGSASAEVPSAVVPLPAVTRVMVSELP